jgi:hypothetical protein
MTLIKRTISVLVILLGQVSVVLDSLIASKCMGSQSVCVKVVSAGPQHGIGIH